MDDASTLSWPTFLNSSSLILDTKSLLINELKPIDLFSANARGTAGKLSDEAFSTIKYQLFRIE